jgi:ABC-type nitrate/sulfonate/bicarbonate transport system permease component
MHQIVTDNASLEVARVWAAVVILMVIGLLLFALAALTERLVVRWR